MPVMYDRRAVISALFFVLTLLVYGFGSHVAGGSKTSMLRGLVTSKYSGSQQSTIPAIIHYAIGTKDDETPIELSFLAFTTIYSAAYHMPHAEIWLHTNAGDKMIERALKLHGLSPPHAPAKGKNGEPGPPQAEYDEYWVQALVKGVKNLKIKRIPRPHHATSLGKPITKLANWADFVRADVLYEHGGAFLDLDAIIIKDLTPLLNSGFRNVLARDLETQCGAILAAPKSDLMKAYRHFMDLLFDPSQYFWHATTLLHSLRETFVRIPGELLMVSDRTFYPVSCANGQTKKLFVLQENDMLGGVHENDQIFDFDYDKWAASYQMPVQGEYNHEGPYGLDFSETYILHVYHSLFKNVIDTNPEKLRDGLTLPLVLEGTSHFARAVLTPIWDAMERGIIKVE